MRTADYNALLFPRVSAPEALTKHSCGPLRSVRQQLREGLPVQPGFWMVGSCRRLAECGSFGACLAIHQAPVAETLVELTRCHSLGRWLGYSNPLTKLNQYLPAQMPLTALLRQHKVHAIRVAGLL